MPTITCVIATYNRCEELRRCLASVYAQTKMPEAVMVIDDDSPDDTKKVVTKEFPAAQYVRLPRRCSQTFGRNLGLMTATTEWVLFLDDDAFLASPEALELALEMGETWADAGILALNITDPTGRPSWDPEAPPFETATYPAGGCIFRRAPCAQCGGYFMPFRFAGEEEELSLRLLEAGWRTIAVPQVVVHHTQSPKNRSWPRVRYLGHRNTVLRDLLRCASRLLP